MADDTIDRGLQPLEREEAWRALMRRLTPPAPMRVTPAQSDMEVFPGESPLTLPVHIPLPPGSRIVGTVPNSSETEQITIYVDAVQSPADTLAFYRARLWSEDWYEFQTGRPAMPGLNDADESYQTRSQFCRGERGPALFVVATQQDNELTAVRISLNTDERASPCRPLAQRGPPPSPIPPLPPPPGAQFVMGAGASGHRGPDGAQSRAVIETELDVAALTAHYTHHLGAGGWTRQDTGEDGLSAWSTWTFQHENGETWRGLLVVFQRPDVPHRYIIDAWAEWPGETREERG